MWIVTCWMRRHKPPTLGWQVTPSVSEIPLWWSKNPRVVLIESTVSEHSHKETEVTMFITHTSQKPVRQWVGGGTMRWMMGSPLSQARNEQERESSRVASTYYLSGVGVEVSNFSRAQLWMVILKVPQEKQRWNLSSTTKIMFLSKCPRCHTVNFQNSNSI